MLLGTLKSLDWHVLQNTFGSFHATLVGAAVAWWNNLGKGHWSLDEAPTFGEHHPRGEGAQRCDAVLCRGGRALGILEAEGSDYPKAFGRMEGYFDDPQETFRSLRFGVLLAYPYEPEGAGDQREYPPVPFEELLACATKVTRDHIGRTVFLVLLSKTYERDRPSARGANEYAAGRVTGAKGYEIAAGEVEYQCVFL